MSEDTKNRNQDSNPPENPPPADPENDPLGKPNPEFIGYVEEGVKPSPEEVLKIITEGPPSELVKGAPESKEDDD